MLQSMLNNKLLPRVILIADQFTEESTRAKALDAVESGIMWVHLRDHVADDASFNEQARSIQQKVDSQTVLTINRRLAVADALGMHFHTSALGPGIAEARKVLGKDRVVGFSAHSREEAVMASEQGADYITYSPIFPTKSKEGHPGHGLERLRDVCDAVAPLPVFALGGITSERVASCKTAGAYGVAVISGILGTADTPMSARRFLDLDEE